MERLGQHDLEPIEIPVADSKKLNPLRAKPRAEPCEDQQILRIQVAQKEQLVAADQAADRRSVRLIGKSIPADEAEGLVTPSFCCSRREGNCLGRINDRRTAPRRRNELVRVISPAAHKLAVRLPAGKPFFDQLGWIFRHSVASLNGRLPAHNATDSAMY